MKKRPVSRLPSEAGEVVGHPVLHLNLALMLALKVTDAGARAAYGQGKRVLQRTVRGEASSWLILLGSSSHLETMHTAVATVIVPFVAENEACGFIFFKVASCAAPVGAW